MRNRIFSEHTRKAIASVSPEFQGIPYFTNNYYRCRELLLKRRNPKAASEAVLLGIQHARIRNLDADLLPVLYIDQMLPDIYEDFKRNGLPEEVFLDSMKDIEIWIQSFRRYHDGKAGLSRIEWVFHSLEGQVLRFGSLQFEEVTYQYPFLLFENRKTGEYAALANPDLSVDQDGYFSGTNKRICRSKFDTRLNWEDKIIAGFPADLIQGTIADKFLSLNHSHWALKLTPGEKATAIHVPYGTDLSPDKVTASMEAAKAYYSGNFLVCDSWLLDPHLKFILPGNSNIISFMERFHKLPYQTAAPQILERVMGFDYSEKSPVDYPDSSSLQSALKKYILEGKEMFTTAGFIPWK